MAQMGKRITLVPKRTTTASENVDISLLLDNCKGAIFFLRISATATDATDVFTLSLEQVLELPKSDKATGEPAETYDDFITFIEAAGNATAPVEQRATWHRDTTVTTDFQALSVGLADDVLHGPITGKIRASVTITDGNDPSFDWALYCWPLEDTP